MMGSKESLPGPAVLFSTSCPPGLQAAVSNLTEDSFTLAFDQVGNVEMMVMMMLKKSSTLVLDQEGKVEMMVMMMLKESFTLLLDQEGKAELSCEDAEGRTYNRTEWAAELLFSQLQVALLLIILLLSEHQGPLFQSPADDRVQLLWLDQSKEGTKVPSGPDYCHHDGRQVKIYL